jgi:ribosomal protein S1
MSNVKNVVYGDPELAHIFEQGDKINKKIKQKRGEIVYCNEPYAEEFYNYLNGAEHTMVIPKIGSVVEGKFVSASENELNFDIGSKDYLRVDKNKRELNFVQGKSSGDIFHILVTNVLDNPHYTIKGSIAALYEAQAHKELKELDSNIPVEALVKEWTPAGYNINIIYQGVQLSAFMPNTLAGVNKLHNPETIVGKTFNVVIESYSVDKGTYIVSRRRYLKTLIPTAVENLEMETVYSGHVTGTTPFGIFIEFEECLTGMIHKSNINPAFADKIQEIVPGTEIDFYIKEVIKTKNLKIILTQILKESLWDSIEPKQTIEAKVKSVKPFGILVALDEETNGLVHQSELDRLGKSEFEEGDDITVKVISIDKMSRKIFLTI